AKESDETGLGCIVRVSGVSRDRGRPRPAAFLGAQFAGKTTPRPLRSGSKSQIPHNLQSRSASLGGADRKRSASAGRACDRARSVSLAVDRASLATASRVGAGRGDGARNVWAAVAQLKAISSKAGSAPTSPTNCGRAARRLARDHLTATVMDVSPGWSARK